jgi:hypothetical protein
LPGHGETRKPRDSDLTAHRFTAIVRAGVFATLAGYQNHDDHDNGLDC